jgi:glycosyltransferase EpsF
MSKTKILYFPGLFATGGVEAIVMNIFRNIDKEKFHIDFCVPRDYECQFDEEVKSFGCKVITIPQIKQTGVINYIKDVKKIIEENGPYQAVHVHSIHNGVYSIIASYFAGVRKRIYHVHNTDDPSLKNMRFPKTYSFIIRKLIKLFSLW